MALATSPNPEEAALAASKAAELMAKFQLDEAVIQAKGDAPDEPVEDGGVLFEGKTKVAWRGFIGGGVAKSLGCYPYWDRGSMVIVGRKSDVTAARYLLGLIVAQVEKLAASGWREEEARQAAATYWNGRGESKRTWMNGFRLGCARVIRERLVEDKRRRDAALRGDQGAAGALVLFDGRARAITALVAKNHPGMRAAKPMGQTRSSGGYQAGTEAGRHVSFGGQSKGALGAGRKSLSG